MNLKNLLRTFLFFELISFAAQSQGSCIEDRIGQGELQWSEASSIRSLNGRWQLEVHPVLSSEENESPVVLRQCGTDKSKVVLILERSAMAYFSPNGDEFIVINRPVRDKYDILIGKSAYLLANDKNSLDKRIGSLIYDAVSKALYPSRPVFFLPRLEKWRNRSMIFAIGGQATVDREEAISDYCFSVEYRAVGGVVSVKPKGAGNGMCIRHP